MALMQVRSCWPPPPPIAFQISSIEIQQSSIRLALELCTLSLFKRRRKRTCGSRTHSVYYTHVETDVRQNSADITWWIVLDCRHFHNHPIFVEFGFFVWLLNINRIKRRMAKDDLCIDSLVSIFLYHFFKCRLLFSSFSFRSLVCTKMRRCLRIDSCRKIFQSEKIKNDNNFSNR